MPPPTDHVLLFDPHLDLSPTAFVTAWNQLASSAATARLATSHTHLTTVEHSAANLILLTSAQPLEPATLHGLIHTVATHCGITQPLHLLYADALTARPDGSPLTIVMPIPDL